MMKNQKETIGDCTLYLGDCIDILPSTGDIDAIVSDPPYGVSENTMRGSAGRGRFVRSKDWKPIHGDNKPFDPERWLACFKYVILWGANNFASRLPDSRGWLVWDKRPNCPSDDNGDCELAFTNLDKVIRKHSQLWRGCIRSGEENMANAFLQHPSQKPLSLMKWCIQQLPADAKTIIDPYMGSGTTGVACAKIGKNFVGIEIDQEYFDVSCKRIEQAYKQPDLFVAPPVRTIQPSFIDGGA